MDREMMGQVLDDLIPGDNTEIALRKATLRESRSSLAMTSLALSRLQAARAFASSGRYGAQQLCIGQPLAVAPCWRRPLRSAPEWPSSSGWQADRGVRRCGPTGSIAELHD